MATGCSPTSKEPLLWASSRTGQSGSSVPKGSHFFEPRVGLLSLGVPFLKGCSAELEGLQASVIFALGRWRQGIGNLKLHSTTYPIQGQSGPHEIKNNRIIRFVEFSSFDRKPSVLAYKTEATLWRLNSASWFIPKPQSNVIILFWQRHWEADLKIRCSLSRTLRSKAIPPHVEFCFIFPSVGSKSQLSIPGFHSKYFSNSAIAQLTHLHFVIKLHHPSILDMEWRKV